MPAIRPVFNVIFLFMCLTLQGCLVGPRALRQTQIGYNESAATALNEQILLNLVRIHYLDTPMFLELSQIVSSHSFQRGLVANGQGLPNVAPFFSGGSLTGTANISESPTLSYKPLQGEDFTKRILSPIAAEILIMLSDAGMDGHLLMMACVREINGLRNLPSTLGPEEAPPATFDDFRKASALLQELQKRDELQLIIASRPGEAGSTMLRIPKRSSSSEEVVELRRILDLGINQEMFKLMNARYSDSPDTIALSGRSLMGTLQFLSRYVDHPAAHTREGLAEETFSNTVGLAGPLLAVKSSKTMPSSSFARISYRGHWFYIDDRDSASKSTFGLLNQLFSLQASPENALSPLITIPTR